MADVPLRMLLGATCGLACVLLLRRPSRRWFGAAPAFTLWLLPLLMGFAPLLPDSLVASGAWKLPSITITARSLPSAVHAASGVPAEDMLMALWAAGALIAFSRLALHYVRLLRALAPIPESWREALAVAAPDLSARRARVHEAGPAVIWAARTLILLPPDFNQRFDADTQRLVLRHELTHLRRGDGLWLLLAELACAVLWFHPLAWLALPRFRLDQELACDERSLRSLVEGGSQYARALLDSVAGRPLPALIPWLTEPQLKERIAMISRIRPGALRRRAGFVAVSSMLAGGLLLGAGMAPVRAAQAKVSASTPPAADITYKNRKAPLYPKDALDRHEQGTVVLKLTVDANGNVQGVQVEPEKSAPSQELRQAAMAAAAQWKFNPGTRNGKPAGGTIEIPVNFSLSAHAADKCPAGQAHASTPPFACIPQPAAKSS
jgi:TonB family protein